MELGGDVFTGFTYVCDFPDMELGNNTCNPGLWIIFLLHSNLTESMGDSSQELSHLCREPAFCKQNSLSLAFQVQSSLSACWVLNQSPLNMMCHSIANKIVPHLH